MDLGQNTAEALGLTYIDSDACGLTRKRKGKGFAYYDADGALTHDEAVKERIKALAIPPAWKDVWICADETGHVLATGRDAAGRKQYIYHPDFRAAREDAKFQHCAAFARALPRLRRKARAALKSRDPETAALAGTLILMDKAAIRIGGDRYAETNETYGAATLLKRHVRARRGEIRLDFCAKGGLERSVTVHDEMLAGLIRRLKRRRGGRLFQVRGRDGRWRAVRASDVNAYLASLAGDEITAKEFRTWAGSVEALRYLMSMNDDQDQDPDATVREACKAASERLGNTPEICKSSYIHPEVIECFREGAWPEAKPNGLNNQVEETFAAILARNGRKAV